MKVVEEATEVGCIAGAVEKEVEEEEVEDVVVKKKMVAPPTLPTSNVRSPEQLQRLAAEEE